MLAGLGIACGGIPTEPTEEDKQASAPRSAPALGAAREPPSRILGVVIVHDPYAGVDWESASQITVQLHDHIGVDRARIRAYDRAGYTAVSLLDYSGVPWLPYARTARLWPPETYLGPEPLLDLEAIRLLIPGAEEVGYDHIVTSFLTQYIEARLATSRASPNTYASTREALALARSRGGMTFLAHPWGGPTVYSVSTDLDGVEIYNAYAAAKERSGEYYLMQWSLDPHRSMLAVWDRLLASDPTLTAIAVNDHYGPDDTELSPDDRLKDSGKVIAVVQEVSLRALRRSLEGGAFFAVRDQGRPKSAQMLVQGVQTDTVAIRIRTTGDVRWISHGSLIAEGAELWLDSVPNTALYARAEIVSGDSVTVFTQAFGLRPRGLELTRDQECPTIPDASMGGGSPLGCDPIPPGH